MNIAAQYFADCQFYGFGGFLFHDIAHCAGAQSTFGIKRLFVHGNHQHGQILEFRLDVFNEINARRAGKRNIHDDQIGFQRANFPQACDGIRNVAAYSQVGFPFDELPHSFAEHGVGRPR
ncbi:MAG: hypothetical protein WDM76_08735 [Limisphaerales bacterium]